MPEPDVPCPGHLVPVPSSGANMEHGTDMEILVFTRCYVLQVMTPRYLNEQWISRFKIVRVYHAFPYFVALHFGRFSEKKRNWMSLLPLSLFYGYSDAVLFTPNIYLMQYTRPWSAMSVNLLCEIYVLKITVSHPYYRQLLFSESLTYNLQIKC